jgi:8-oxo-dGTP diphosphatase
MRFGDSSMAFQDMYRMSVHAVITNDRNEVLLLRQTYGNLTWGLPAGAVDPGETSSSFG